MRKKCLKTLGNNLRRLRVARGWTQEQLAEKASLHPNYIGGIERGVRNPAFLALASMISALGCKADDLFVGVTTKHSKTWNP